MATIKKNTANSTEMKESWNTIRGAMRVFVKCFDNGTSISVGIGKKDGETWTNFYLPVYVSQSCKIELKEGLNLISVKNAFLSPFKRKDGTAGIQLVIAEASVI